MKKRERERCALNEYLNGKNRIFAKTRKSKERKRGRNTRLLFVPTRGIDDDQITPLFFEQIDAFARDFNRIVVVLAAVEWYFCFRGVLLELCERTGTERIGADQPWLEPFTLVPIRELGDGGCFASALQADHHQHVRLAFRRFEWLDLRVQQVAEPFEDCLADNVCLADSGADLFEASHLRLHALPQF